MINGAVVSGFVTASHLHFTKRLTSEAANDQSLRPNEESNFSARRQKVSETTGSTEGSGRDLLFFKSFTAYDSTKLTQILEQLKKYLSLFITFNKMGLSH